MRSAIQDRDAVVDHALVRVQEARARGVARAQARCQRRP